MGPARIWLSERRVFLLVVATLLLGIFIGVFASTFVPQPFSITQASVPLVAYLPCGAALIASVQLLFRLDPYESLTLRPIWRYDVLLLLLLTLVFGVVMIVSYGITDQPLALMGARNFALGLWAGVSVVAALGVRRGSAIAVTTLILLVPLTPRGPQGDSSWWALSEAPYNSLPTIGVVALVVAAGGVSLKWGNVLRAIFG